MTDTPGDVAAKLEQSLVPFATWDGGRAIQVGLGTYDTKQIDISLRDLRAAASMLREMGEREKALREALEPFARVYGLSCEPFQPDHKAGARDYLPGAWPTVGDLRRAAKALEPK